MAKVKLNSASWLEMVATSNERKSISVGNRERGGGRVSFRRRRNGLVEKDLSQACSARPAKVYIRDEARTAGSRALTPLYMAITGFWRKAYTGSRGSAQNNGKER